MAAAGRPADAKEFLSFMEKEVEFPLGWKAGFNQNLEKPIHFTHLAGRAERVWPSRRFVKTCQLHSPALYTMQCNAMMQCIYIYTCNNVYNYNNISIYIYTHIYYIYIEIWSSPEPTSVKPDTVFNMFILSLSSANAMNWKYLSANLCFLMNMCLCYQSSFNLDKF